MDSMKSLADIFAYADKHGISAFVMIGAVIVVAIAWIGKKGGSKAISVVGGVLEAADKMLESMQKRHDALTKALDKSEQLNAHYRELNERLKTELVKAHSSLAECNADCRECRRKLRGHIG